MFYLFLSLILFQELLKRGINQKWLSHVQTFIRGSLILANITTTSFGTTAASEKFRSKKRISRRNFKFEQITIDIHNIRIYYWQIIWNRFLYWANYIRNLSKQYETKNRFLQIFLSHHLHSSRPWFRLTHNLNVLSIVKFLRNLPWGAFHLSNAIRSN